MTETQTFSLFLGCVMPNRFPNIEKSLRVVLPELDINLEELEGASCCPAPGVIRSFSDSTWLALASRNLALAEKAGHDIITGCSGCYGTFKEAIAAVHEKPSRLKEVQRILKEVDLKYTAKTNARHIIEVIYEIGPEEIKRRVKRPLTGVKVAVHYGCHLLKPSRFRPWKKTQKPTFLDDLVEALGAESVSYRDKSICCGAGGGVRSGNMPLSVDIAKEKLDSVIDAEADCIVNACSFCHLQYESAQEYLNNELGEMAYQIPVIYFTQLLGLALGFGPDELGLGKHIVSTKRLLDKVL
ncbi:MAG: CoB--CoM heterodisulfide reductase subunit B [Candidatus Thorarchaeota archaeon]